MQLNKIIGLANVFNSLMGEKLPRVWTYAIKANIRIIQPYLEGYEDARKSALREHAGDEEKIREELEALLKREENVALAMVPASELGELFTLGQEVALEPMVEPE